MTHPLRKQTKVDVDGITFSLVFDIRAVAEAEQLLNQPLILGLTEQMIQRPTVNEVCAMFYAAAKAQQPDLTLAAIHQLLDAATWKDAAATMAIMRNAVLTAWAEANVDPTETTEDTPANPTLDQS